MVDFTPPFANDGERRVPTGTERSLGFPCGPLDRDLFHGLIWLLEANIKGVMDEAGVVPGADFDETTLYRAIDALINAATGGNPAGYVLMSQARARLPIFPEILNADGRIVVTSPAPGTIRIPGGVSFLHRGIFSVTTAQTDFLTDASKTYHLRWNSVDGFTLKDLANLTYNPSSLVETNEVFDSNYDDMLVARIITNSSNVASITNLSNLNRLWRRNQIIGVPTLTPFPAMTYTFTATDNYNWSRAPKLVATKGAMSANSTAPGGLDATANYLLGGAVTRYSTTESTVNDYLPNTSLIGASAYIKFELAA